MLKLTASYAKKVPASQEYSSQNYHAGVEIEIPDNLPPDELRRRIQSTFALVRESVEAELNGDAYGGESEERGEYSQARDERAVERTGGRSNGRPSLVSAGVASTRSTDLRRQPGEPVRLVSSKQVKYLVDLAARNGYDLATLDRVAEDRYGVATVHELSKHQASKLIDSLSARPDRRAA